MTNSMKTPSINKDTTMEVTDATDIHPFRKTLFAPSRKCRKKVLKFIPVISSLLVTDDLSMLNRKNAFTHGVHDIPVVGSHDDGGSPEIDFIQRMMPHEVSGSRLPVGSSAIMTEGC